MSVTSVADVRALVPAARSMADADLEAVIDRIEAEIVARIGGPYVDASTGVRLVLQGGEGAYLALPRRIETVQSVTEYSDPFAAGVSLTEGTDFAVIGDQGLLVRSGGRWGARVDVTFVPQDDRAAWKQAVIDLARIDIERTAQFQEAVGGEYSYTAPSNWERERRRILRRLRL